MTVRELIHKDFGVDLPIKGGPGNTLEHPVIIEYQGFPNDYVGTEHAYLKYLGLGREIEWERTGQRLLTRNNRKIDEISIRCVKVKDGMMSIKNEKFYFDITECFGK